MQHKRPIAETLIQEPAALASATVSKRARPDALEQVDVTMEDYFALDRLYVDALSHICQYLPTRSFLNLRETCRALNNSLKLIPLRQHQTFTVDLLSVVGEMYCLPADFMQSLFNSVFPRCNRLRLSHYGVGVMYLNLVSFSISNDNTGEYLDRVFQTLSLFSHVETIILHANKPVCDDAIEVYWTKVLAQPYKENVAADRVISHRETTLSMGRPTWPIDAAFETPQTTTLVLPRLKHIFGCNTSIYHNKRFYPELAAYAGQLVTCEGLDWLLKDRSSVLSMPHLQSVHELSMKHFGWLDASNVTALRLYENYVSKGEQRAMTDLHMMTKLKSYTMIAPCVNIKMCASLLKALPEQLQEVSFRIHNYVRSGNDEEQAVVLLPESLTKIKFIHPENKYLPFLLPPLPFDSVTKQYQRRELVVSLSSELQNSVHGIIPQHCTDYSVFAGIRAIDLTSFMLNERSQQLRHFYLHDGIRYDEKSYLADFNRDRVQQFEHVTLQRRKANQLTLSSLPKTLESLTLECKVKKIVIDSDLPPNMTSLRLPMLTVGVINKAFIDWSKQLLKDIRAGKSSLKHFHAAFVDGPVHAHQAPLQRTFEAIKQELAIAAMQGANKRTQ